MRILALTLVLSLLSACESTGLLDDLLTSQSGGSQAGLSNDTIANGLREALTVGSERAVGTLGTKDGFFGSAFRIPLPEKLEQARGVASKFGLGGTFDDLELKMNRAAEHATPIAKDLFVSSIKQMTFADVVSIYQGSDDAATQYLKKTTSAGIETQMRPVIETSMSEVGAVQTFTGLVNQYNALPLVTPVDADVTGHVMTYAKDAIFSQLAVEEAAIRKNPLKRSSELLRTVFGS